MLSKTLPLETGRLQNDYHINKLIKYWRDKMRKLEFKDIILHALMHSLLILIVSLFLVFTVFENHHLLVFLLIFIIGFISYSTFLILLLKKSQNDQNFFKTGILYLFSVLSLSIIYGILLFFVLPNKFLFILYSPLFGLVMSLIIPFFYNKK